MLSPNIVVGTLRMLRIDDVRSLSHTVARHVSTLRGGTLYFESLNGKKRELRQGENLQFTKLEGELRFLEMHKDFIILKFGGRVRGMTIGSRAHHRSLMPTYLEWMKANQALALLWSTTLYAFGLILSVLHWWRIAV